jgi:hypothetical protein
MQGLRRAGRAYLERVDAGGGGAQGGFVPTERKAASPPPEVELKSTRSSLAPE